MLCCHYLLGNSLGFDRRQQTLESGLNCLIGWISFSSAELALYDWFKERLELQFISDDVLSKFVPAHINVFYCFGGIVLTSPIIQASSGFALTMYYKPTVVGAYSSVSSILFQVHLG